MRLRSPAVRFALPLALLLGCLAIRPAVAADELTNSKVVTSLQPSEIQSILNDMDITYKVDKDEQGDPTWAFKPGTYSMMLFVYAKDDATGGYGSLQMYVGFSIKATLEKINEWNAQRRYIRAYRSDAGGARLESDLDLSGGVTVGAVKTFLHKFETWADAFATHLSSN